MTIAMCHLSSEGVVLGADSTSSTVISPSPGFSGYHYFDYNQKLFELGENATFGVLTWGLGTLGIKSHRTVFALASDALQASPPKSTLDAASSLCDIAWDEYSKGSLASLIQQCKILATKKDFDPNAANPDPSARTKDEEALFQQLKTGLVPGFCIGGYAMPGRIPEAYWFVFDPLGAKPLPIPIPQNTIPSGARRI